MHKVSTIQDTRGKNDKAGIIDALISNVNEACRQISNAELSDLLNSASRPLRYQPDGVEISKNLLKE